MEASAEDGIDWDNNIYAADNTQARFNRINRNNTRPEDAYSWRSLLDSLDHVSTGQTLPPKETEFPSVVDNPQATSETAYGDLRDSSTIVLANTNSAVQTPTTPTETDSNTTLELHYNHETLETSSVTAESSSSISTILQLNDWDRDQITLTPITCNIPRNGRVSQGDPSLQKFALKQQEPPNDNMEVDTVDLALETESTTSKPFFPGVEQP